MSRAVQDFYTNVAMREAVKQYFLESIEREVIYKVFRREDATHLADALDLIEKVFKDMEEFEAKKEPTNLNNHR